MGLFDKFFKRSVKETANETVNEFVNDSKDVIINGVNFRTDYNRDHNHFRDMINANFSEYTIEEKVPVSCLEVGASDAFTPISYLLSQNGNPVAAIAIVPAFKCASQRAREICRSKKIAYVPFYGQYENTESYVVERIRKYIRRR